MTKKMFAFKPITSEEVLKTIYSKNQQRIKLKESRQNT